jgi:hypothetical protein
MKKCEGYHQNKARLFVSKREMAETIAAENRKSDETVSEEQVAKPESGRAEEADEPVFDKPKPPPSAKKDRRCMSCNCKLSLYNKGSFCWQCQQKGASEKWQAKRQLTQE